jgi:hypothetical protein
MSYYSVLITKCLQKYTDDFYKGKNIKFTEDDHSVYITGSYNEKDAEEFRVFALGIYYTLNN